MDCEQSLDHFIKLLIIGESSVTFQLLYLGTQVSPQKLHGEKSK